MATHSSIPAWKTPWTEKPGGLQSMGVTESGTTEHRSQSRFCTHISPIPGQGLVSTKHDCFCRTHLGDKGTCLGSATPPRACIWEGCTSQKETPSMHENEQRRAVPMLSLEATVEPCSHTQDLS